MNSYNKGKIAEFMARMYMRLHGYRIIDTNYITGRGSTAGEIDFIAKRWNTIVFVEVKQRESLNNAAYAILPHQQERILRGARSYLQHHPQYRHCQMRFDAILIAFPWQIRHISNAWHI